MQTAPRAFLFCDKCERETWQKRSDAPPDTPIPHNAYMTIHFAQVMFARKVHVSFGSEATKHLKNIFPKDIVLTFAELMALKEGVAEAPEGEARALRLVEAINYFARAQKVPEMAFYAGAAHNMSGSQLAAQKSR